MGKPRGKKKWKGSAVRHGGVSGSSLQLRDDGETGPDADEGPCGKIPGMYFDRERDRYFPEAQRAAKKKHRPAIAFRLSLCPPTAPSSRRPPKGSILDGSGRKEISDNYIPARDRIVRSIPRVLRRYAAGLPPRSPFDCVPVAARAAAALASPCTGASPNGIQLRDDTRRRAATAGYTDSDRRMASSRRRRNGGDDDGVGDDNYEDDDNDDDDDDDGDDDEEGMMGDWNPVDGFVSRSSGARNVFVCASAIPPCTGPGAVARTTVSGRHAAGHAVLGCALTSTRCGLLAIAAPHGVLCCDVGRGVLSRERAVTRDRTPVRSLGAQLTRVAQPIRTDTDGAPAMIRGIALHRPGAVGGGGDGDGDALLAWATRDVIMTRRFGPSRGVAGSHVHVPAIVAATIGGGRFAAVDLEPVPMAFSADGVTIGALTGRRAQGAGLEIAHVDGLRSATLQVARDPSVPGVPRCIASDPVRPGIFWTGGHAAGSICMFDLRSWSPGHRPSLSLRGAASAMPVSQMYPVNDGLLATLDVDGVAAVVDPRFADNSGSGGGHVVVSFHAGRNRGPNVGFAVDPSGALAALERDSNHEFDSATTTGGGNDSNDAVGGGGGGSNGVPISLFSLQTGRRVECGPISVPRPLGHLPLALAWPHSGVIVASAGTGEFSTVSSLHLPTEVF